jgi:hypothetical protein
MWYSGKCVELGFAVQVITQRLMKLQTKGTPSHVPAWVHIKRRRRNKKGQIYWEVVHAKGHLDEVQALSKPLGMLIEHILQQSVLHVGVNGMSWACALKIHGLFYQHT